MVYHGCPEALLHLLLYVVQPNAVESSKDVEGFMSIKIEG